MHINFKSTLSSDGEDSWTISGIAVPYGVATTDRFYEISFNRGSFSQAITNFSDQTVIPILHSHDSDQLPIGKVTQLYDTDEGLMFKAELTKGLADKHRLAIKAGTLQGISVGVKFNAAADDDGKMQVESVDELFEISLVNFPALKGAKVEEATLSQQQDVAKITETLAKHESLKNIERLLRKLGGISAKEAKAIISGLKGSNP
jgi:HK97 family phage prohead protease